MSNKKHTVTKWLFHKIWEATNDKFTWYAILTKAKEMEKQQMIDFHISVMKKGLIIEGYREWTDVYLPKIREVAEQCYKETYER